MKHYWSIIFILVSTFALLPAVLSYSCKEGMCASIVSKCLLIDACKCDFVNCTCCAACSQCLGALYVDCCECVDMCPKEVTTPSNNSKTHTAEDLPDPLPELFNALTEEHDPTARWTTFTYPVHRDLPAFMNPLTQGNLQVGTLSRDSPTTGWAARNCTVAFMAQCMPWSKCRNSCRSMGASSYKWFHDGCCQCVGSNCLNYGMNESRCLHCPRISPNGIMEDEYEGGPDADEDQPRKHVDTTGTDDSSETTAADDRSYPAPPLPYISQAQKSARAKSVNSIPTSNNNSSNVKSKTGVTSLQKAAVKASTSAIAPLSPAVSVTA